jgi:hypothetical protein
MSSEQSSKPAGWFTGRTRLITIVSIVAVGLAGASAVSANIGILDSASDSPVGNASLTRDLVTPSTQVVDVYLPDTSAATAPTTAASVPGADPTVQRFAIDVAGTVGIAATDAGLRLDQVTPATGWSWTLAQSDPTALMVTMTNGARTFEFTATATGDGNIAASVNEPIVIAAPANSNGDEDDDEHEDEDEHEDHQEYEGGEDDD